MTSRVKVVALWCGLILLFLVVPAAAQTSSAAGSANTQKAAAYGRLPLSFEPNQGQTNPEVKFLARGSGYGLFLTSTEMVLALRQHPAGSQSPNTNRNQSVLRASLVGANPKPEVLGERELPGKSNYFTGKDPARWRTNVPQFAAVRYRSVYPGVDVVYYGNQQQLEYDFVVAPGADPRAIRIRFTGRVRLGKSGDLVISVGGGEVTVRAPELYQEINGARQSVEGRFAVRGRTDVVFEVGRYDTGRNLVIDPKVLYSTYLGGSDKDWAVGAADSAGNVYLSGFTYSPDFPQTGQLNDSTTAQPRAFVTKLSADGQAIVYSTFVGEVGYFSLMAVDGLGRVHLFGPPTRDATNVPLVNPLQSTCDTEGIRGYVLTLGPSGNDIVHATFLCGSIRQYLGYDLGLFTAIATDANGNTYLTGYTRDPTFPPAVNAFQSALAGTDPHSGDAFVVKLDVSGGWVYSTYLGGSSSDFPGGIAADAEGNAYVVGETYSDDFPVANAAQPQKASPADNFLGNDGFVTKFSPDGSALVYSTYWGGSSRDVMEKVVVNAAGFALVAGGTASADFPTTPGRPRPSLDSDAYPGTLLSLDAGGAVRYSTGVHLRAGSSAALALDSADNIYIAGSRNSFQWPLVNPLMSVLDPQVANVVVEKLDPTANTVLFSTVWGGPYRWCQPDPNPDVSCGGLGELVTGLGVDGAGNIHIVGVTFNDRYPTVNALQSQPGGAPTPSAMEYAYFNFDAFVVKIAQTDNTLPGTQVTVVPRDGATITFDGVTGSGTTSFGTTTENPWTPPPDGFRLGDPPIFYEISSTASYTGGITICVDYSKVSFSVEWGLGLYHYENGEWKNITTSVDTGTNTICGVATSLSPFAIFGAPLPPIDVAGFAAPLASLVATGGTVSWPDKAFKLGRTLPLKLQLLVNGAPLSDQEVQGPKIVEVSRQGDPVLNLDTIDLNTGAANDNGLAFRFSDGSWVYNLSTQGLSPGRYVITIQLWDGRRLQGGFELKR